MITVILASESLSISFGQFSNENKTRGEHGLPAYIHSLVICKLSDFIRSTIDGNNLFRKTSIVRKNRI